MNKRFAFLCSCVIILLGIGAFAAYYFATSKVEYAQANLAVDPESTAELIGFYDYVFVGTVKKHLGNFATKEPYMPYNKYIIEVLENIKGELNGEVELKKKGGYRGFTLILYECGNKKDFLLDTGGTYIFLAAAQKDGSLLVETAYGSVLIDTNARTNAVEKYKRAYENEITYERQRWQSVYDVKR